MAFWSRIFRRVEPDRVVRPAVHDFTFTFDGHNVTMVKDLDDCRVFITGSGSTIRRGDSILVRRRERMMLRYKVEDVQQTIDEWRAYARLEVRLGRPKTPVRSL